MSKIRTLGLYQPYASLMLHGKVESRWVKAGKKPPFPLGKYMIYSTKKSYSEKEFKHISGGCYRYAVVLLEDESTKNLNGYAIAVADLVEVTTFGQSTGMPENRAFVDTPMDQWESNDPITIDGHVLTALVFENVKRIKPFPFKGKQGVGFLTEEQVSKIEIIKS